MKVNWRRFLSELTSMHFPVFQLLQLLCSILKTHFVISCDHFVPEITNFRPNSFQHISHSHCERRIKPKWLKNRGYKRQNHTLRYLARTSFVAKRHISELSSPMYHCRSNKDDVLESASHDFIVFSVLSASSKDSIRETALLSIWSNWNFRFGTILLVSSTTLSLRRLLDFAKSSTLKVPFDDSWCKWVRSLVVNSGWLKRMIGRGRVFHARYLRCIVVDFNYFVEIFSPERSKKLTIRWWYFNLQNRSLDINCMANSWSQNQKKSPNSFCRKTGPLISLSISARPLYFDAKALFLASSSLVWSFRTWLLSKCTCNIAAYLCRRSESFCSLCSKEHSWVDAD